VTGHADTWARRVRAIVDHPLTNVVKGFALMLIGVSDASDTFREDLQRGHFRAGHGLILIGLFSVLNGLPYLIESLDSIGRYFEVRDRDRPPGGDDTPAAP